MHQATPSLGHSLGPASVVHRPTSSVSTSRREWISGSRRRVLALIVRPTPSSTICRNIPRARRPAPVLERDPVPSELISDAFVYAYALSDTRYHFVDSNQEEQLYRESWAYVCQSNEQPILVNDRIVNKIRDLVSQQRGQFLSAIRQLTSAHYKSPGQDALTVEEARSLVEGGLFAFKDTKTREGPYQNQIIEHVITRYWFPFKHSVGDQYFDLFAPVSTPMVAYVLSLVESCIKEHFPGAHKQESINLENHRARFEFFCQELEDLSDRSNIEQATSFDRYMKNLTFKLRAIKAEFGRQKNAVQRFDWEICGDELL